MATKLQRITQLSYDSTKELSSQSKWTDFLNSAAWHYKYPFEDQVLIYAQRPDATACADFDTWSTKLNRRINRGAKGIALLREQGNEYFLDHVFDILDTTPRTRNAVIRLWEYNDKYDDAIIETLENTFGELKITTTLTDAIICAAHNAVEDNKADYLSELRYTKGDSFLADLDELNVDVEFQQTAEASVAYMIMQRMGLHPEEVFDDEEFRHIIDFNTIETMSVLGNAVSEISEQALREISSTIVAEAKKEQQQAKIFAENKNVEYNNVKEETQPQIHTERNDINDRGNLQERERDSDTELGSTEEQTFDRQIRNDEEEISQEEQTEPLFGNDDSRNIDEPSSRNRQNSEGTGRGNGTEDGEIGGRDGETESGESAEVDRTYEQPQTFRRRSSPQTVSSQLSLFDLIEDEDVAVSMAREAERLNNIRPAFSISQEIIDTVLCDGTNANNSVLEIAAEFSKDKPLKDKVEFLKDHYKTDGKGFILDDKQISAWWNENGITITYGNTVETGNKHILSWEDVARRIDELLDIGRFAPSNILLQIDDYIYTKTAENFWYMYRDLNYDDYPELRELFTDKAFERKGGFPEDVKRLKEFFKTSAGLDMTKTAVQKVCDMRDEGKDVTRFWYINPHETNKMLEDLYIVRKQYTSQSLSYVPPARFITEDEITKQLLKGTGGENGRYHIYIYFMENSDKYERQQFLKKEYGIGGSGSFVLDENHDGKGISLSHGDLMQPYAKTLLKWNEVERRIDKLIKRGIYLSQKDIENIPNYEKNEIAAAVHSSFSSVMDESRYKPYPKDLYYLDTTARKYIIEKLDNPEQMAEMIFELRNLLMETPKDDEWKFNTRTRALEMLESYADGTFNLFPSIERPALNAPLPKVSEQESFADFYARVHAEDDGKTVALFPVGDFYEAVGADAEAIAETLDFHLTHRTIEDVEYPMCVFPKHRLEENVNVLTEKGFDVILVDDDGNPHKVISREKALGLPESTVPAEVIEEPDEDVAEETPEGLQWDEGTAMRIAQEEWEKAHRSPVHRPTYEQRNYNFMREFAPDVLQGNVRYALYESQGFMPIHINRLSEDTISISHTYEQNGDLMYDPEMVFEIDEENGALKPLEYRQDNLGIYQVVGENVTDRELSSFAVEWFKNISNQGFNLAQERLDYNFEDIVVSYNERGEVVDVEGEENAVALYIEENGVEFPVDETAELVGKEITIDDRRFIVDSVNRDFDTVSLKDITFQEGMGFPIFRRESVDFVKAALEQQKDAEKIVPEFEKIKQSKVANTVVYPEIPMAQRTNFVIDNDELGYGGAKEKFRKNMEAIRVLKECEFDHRLATPEEQKILSEYVGWGGLSDAFDETKSSWADEFQELYTALSPEEYEQARASTLTSHYTSPVIIKSMYKALENMGFSQGNILEPSCGIGNFMGLVPESMADSKIYGIEIDSITGRIAQQLYQRNSVAIQGYEDTSLPDSFFDVAIGNPAVIYGLTA